MGAVVQHSSESNEHYTPREFIEAARGLLGVIDLDPATTKEVNERTVKATHYFDKNDDGLKHKWLGNVWLNPPGGVVKGRSNAALWWEKLVEEWSADRVKGAVFLGFTLEILKTTQTSKRWIGEFPCCFPKSRIQFLDEKFQPQKSPGHANVIAYLPPRGMAQDSLIELSKFFFDFGRCK